MEGLSRSEYPNSGDNLNSDAAVKLKEELISKGLTLEYLSKRICVERESDQYEISDFSVSLFNIFLRTKRTAFYQLDVVYKNGTQETFFCKEYIKWANYSDSAGVLSPGKEKARYEGFLHHVLSKNNGFVPKYIARISKKDTNIIVMEKFAHSGYELLECLKNYKKKDNEILEFDEKIGHVTRLIIDAYNINNHILNKKLEELVFSRGGVLSPEIDGSRVPISSILRNVQAQYAVNSYYDEEIKKSISALSECLCEVNPQGSCGFFNENQRSLDDLCMNLISKQFDKGREKESEEEKSILVEFHIGQLVFNDTFFNKATSLFEAEEYGKKTLKNFLADNPWTHYDAVILSQGRRMFEGAEKRELDAYDGIGIIDYATVAKVPYVLGVANFLNSISDLLNDNIKLIQMFEHALFSMMRINQSVFSQGYDSRVLSYKKERWAELIEPALRYFAFKEMYYRHATLCNVKDERDRKKKIQQILSNFSKKLKRYPDKRGEFKALTQFLSNIIKKNEQHYKSLEDITQDLYGGGETSWRTEPSQQEPFGKVDEGEEFVW